MITMTLADYADDDKDEDKNGKHGDGKDISADNASLMLIIIIVYVIYFIDPCLFAQLPSRVFSRVAMRRPPPPRLTVILNSIQGHFSGVEGCLEGQQNRRESQQEPKSYN